MKKLITISAMFVCMHVVHAQSYGMLGIGYQVGVFHLANINRTVYTYNYTRQWLTQKMPYFENAKGYQLHFATMPGNWGIDLAISTLAETNEAYGIETATGLEAHREIFVRQLSWSYGFRYVVKEGDHTEIGFTLSIDRNRLIANTGYTNGQESTYMRCVLEKTWGNTLRINLSWFPVNAVGLSVRPFVTLPWGKVNTEGLIYYLNGDYNTQRGYAWNYGCTLNLTFRFGHDNY